MMKHRKWKPSAEVLAFAEECVRNIPADVMQSMVNKAREAMEEARMKAIEQDLPPAPKRFLFRDTLGL